MQIAALHLNGGVTESASQNVEQKSASSEVKENKCGQVIIQEVSTALLGFQYKQGVALFIRILVLLIRPKELFNGTT